MPTTIDGANGVSKVAPSGVNQAAIADGVVGKGPAFSAYQAVAQSIGAADTVLTLDTEEFDTASCFNTTTGRFTPNVPGYYQINGTAQINGTTSTFYCVLYKNGVSHRYGSLVPVSAGSPISSVSALVYFNGTTDYVDLRASSNTPLNSFPGVPRCVLSGALVRAA